MANRRDDGRTEDEPPTVDADRRRFLGLAGGGALGVGLARCVYAVVGFGTLGGTNLTEQPLGAIARRHLRPFPFDLSVGDRRLSFDGDVVDVESAAGDPVATVDVADSGGETGDDALGEEVSTALDALAADLDALAADEFTVEFSGHEAFFERLREARTRPLTVAALRGVGFRRPNLDTLRAFTGVDPQDPAALVEGLAAGFRERTHFDNARYVASVLQDLLLDAVPLEAPFRESTDFESILDGTAGLYCYEYALRSVEAFHAVAPNRQSVPVFGGVVYDGRHNHVYTALGSAVREDGKLRVPMTFLDYSHATSYDTYHLRWALGDGVDAYGEHHRASTIHYANRYGY